MLLLLLTATGGVHSWSSIYTDTQHKIPRLKIDIKLNRGLVALYNIRPGNGTDLFSQVRAVCGSVELAALHAATKNMINLTARTGGPYAGGALSRSPYTQQM